MCEENEEFEWNDIKFSGFSFKGSKFHKIQLPKNEIY